MICVEGSLRTGKYQDKKYSDVTHYTTDVFVDNVEFCGDKGGQAQTQSAQNPAKNIVSQATASGIETDFEELLCDDTVPF